MSEKEVRFQVGLELRAASEASMGPGTLVGYASCFNCLSEELTDRSASKRAFREIVKPGAFSRSLKTSDVRALVNHDPDQVVGRNRAGTLRMMEDERGLRVEIDLPDTTSGRDTAVSVARGDMTGMSFGFRTIADSWDLSGAMPLRSLEDVDLDDVSVVTFPAYPDTAVALRSLDKAMETPAPTTPEPPAEAARTTPLSTLKARLRLAGDAA